VVGSANNIRIEQGEESLNITGAQGGQERLDGLTLSRVSAV
jgi:hypothetical protein